MGLTNDKRKVLKRWPDAKYIKSPIFGNVAVVSRLAADLYGISLTGWRQCSKTDLWKIAANHPSVKS